MSEWPARSQDIPLTLSATHGLDVYTRYEVVLSLDQPLPYCSRMRGVSILVQSSDPHWDEGDHSGEPTLLNRPFFRETLPNPQRLDFRATHIRTNQTYDLPELLFVGELLRLKELGYLRVTGGLTETVKNLVSCEMGLWLGLLGPPLSPQGGFIRSLTTTEPASR